MKRWFIIFVIFLLHGFSYLYADIKSEQIRNLLDEAENHFSEGNKLASDGDKSGADIEYRASQVRYERIIDLQDSQNGYVLYNLGNVYFSLGDVGRAILYYLKAQLLIPQNKNLQQSLDYVRSQRIDNIEPSLAKVVYRVIFFWHYIMNIESRFWIVTISMNVICIFFLLRILKGSRFRHVILKHWSWYCVGLFVFVVMPLSSWLVLDEVSMNQGNAVVLLSEVIAKRGDSDFYESTFNEPLHAGTELIVIQKRRDWVQFRLADGREGWIREIAIGYVNGS